MLSSTARGYGTSSDSPTATMNTSPSPPPLDSSTLLAFGYSKLTLPLAHNHHHVLRRCISDLNSSPVKTFSRSSSSNEMSVDDGSNTPNSKRLKRMKSRLKEMSEWCNQLMRDEEFEQDEELGSQDIPDIDATQDIPNDTSTEDSSEKEFSESVSVEKKDDSLVIHFRCHCDKAYQFLLCGGDCYYKLL